MNNISLLLTLTQVEEQVTHTFSFYSWEWYRQGGRADSLTTCSCSEPQPTNYTTNAAIWDCKMSRSLNSLNESLEPKKSQWVSGNTKEHPEFQIMMRNLFQTYLSRTTAVKILTLSKAVDSLPWLHVRITWRASQKQDAWALPQTNWIRNSRGWCPGITFSENSPGDYDPQRELRITALKPCYSNWGPYTSNGITWERKGNAESQAPL